MELNFLGNQKKKNEKTKETCLKKYGTTSTFKSTQIKEKIKNTNLQKYGCKNPMQSIIVKNKVKIKNFKKLIDRCIKNGYEPLFSLDDYKT